MIKKHCYEVVISWDGIATEHDLSRGKGSSLKALNALESLKKAGVKTRANCVFTKFTYNRLNEILDIANEKKFSVCFQPVWEKTLTYAEHYLGMEQVQILAAIDFMIEQKKLKNKALGNSLNSLLYWKDLIINPQKVKCKAGQVFARIEPNGDLRKCGRVEEKIPYRDILVTGLEKSFANLLNFEECTSCQSWASINTNTLL